MLFDDDPMRSIIVDEKDKNSYLTLTQNNAGVRDTVNLKFSEISSYDNNEIITSRSTISPHKSQVSVDTNQIVSMVQ